MVHARKTVGERDVEETEPVVVFAIMALVMAVRSVGVEGWPVRWARSGPGRCCQGLETMQNIENGLRAA